jgi:elongation factor P
MEQAGNIRRGTIVQLDGELFLVTHTEFRNPGNWRAILHLTLKNLRTGVSADKRFRPQDKLEVAFVDQREAQYLYSDANYHYFMFNDTFEQEQFPKDVLGDDILYLVPNTKVQIRIYDGKPVSVELPVTVPHVIKQTEPTLKGATAQAQYKPAVTESGLKVKVPAFIDIGEVVDIDTRTGEYLGRSNK